MYGLKNKETTILIEICKYLPMCLVTYILDSA